ncbi:MAG TPA: sigma-54 dependent transcriptional regulator, partial [Pseudomonadales bacterium]|nr:sigma-54 dependent transcriptional regulator [Pseudomonadales bacterium]
WNVMNVVLKGSDKEELAEKLCSHLHQSFGLDRVAVLESNGESVASLAGKIAGSDGFGGVADLELSEQDFIQIRGVVDREASRVSYDDTHIFSLSPNALLYIVVRDKLAPADLEFLQTLVSYLSGGFARYSIAAGEPETFSQEALLFRSAQMQAVMESVKLVAPTDATVLVVGESGTGKERLARAIHDASTRSDKPFIIVDCGAVVGSLIESELFGHVKGAFTGADRNFSGRLKEANGGTVLLDEVGELPLDVQVKLLRFVQEHQIAAVGSNRYETVDTRIVAATNRDLPALVAAGEFREDLYYRLNVFSIVTPPLRDRPEDIMLLARHYLGVYASRYGKRITGYSKDAERALQEQQWPGNIRELMNVINRAVILCRDSLVTTIHLGLFPANRHSPERESEDAAWSLEAWLKDLVDHSLAADGDLPPLGQWLEDDLILTSMSINEDVLNRAAQTLGIPESTLRRKVTRLRDAPSSPRPIHGDAVATVMGDLVDVARSLQQPVLDVVFDALLRELEKRGLNRKQAAALMGVSLPTYRKMVNDSP